MSVSVDAAKAPATIGPQLTADDEDSVEAGAEAGASVADKVVSMASSYRMNSASRMMIGIGTPSSQSRMPRPMMVSSRMMVAKNKARRRCRAAVESGGLCHFVGGRVGQFRQRLVRLGLLLQRLIEQLDGIFQAENLGPALERAVTRDLVVFDRLRR
jgi:hypothetical protein